MSYYEENDYNKTNFTTFFAPIATTTDQQIWTSPNQEKVKIGRIILICIYGSLSIGVLFNCSVVGTILNIFRNLKRLTSVNKHTFLYILSLSLVDALVLINMPFIVTDMLTGWVFGSILCKLHLTTEMINKTLSTFILTSLSFDRFLIVCYPHRFRTWRQMKVTALVLLACCISAGLLLMPVYMYTLVGPLEFGNKSITKCISLWYPSAHGKIYLYSIFGLGYCLPLILMTIFYSCIVAKMWRSSARTRRQNARGYTRKVTQRTALLVVFYFFCWTPYWAVHFYLDHTAKEQDINLQIVMFHFIHVLVYVNSTVNPLLYALLNRELRRQCFTAKQKRAQNGDTVELPTSVAANGRNHNINKCCQTYPIKSLC